MNTGTWRGIIFFKKDELAIGRDRKEKDANGKRAAH
jgi:hypothetical protein